MDPEGSVRRLAVRLVRSMIGERRETRRTLRALGLRKVSDTAVHADTPSIRGMVARVRHLVEVEELEPSSARRPEPASRAGGER